jgi:hypothetical protein
LHCRSHRRVSHSVAVWAMARRGKGRSARWCRGGVLTDTVPTNAAQQSGAKTRIHISESSPQRSATNAVPLSSRYIYRIYIYIYTYTYIHKYILTYNLPPFSLLQYCNLIALRNPPIPRYLSSWKHLTFEEICLVGEGEDFSDSVAVLGKRSLGVSSLGKAARSTRSHREIPSSHMPFHVM